MRIEFDSKNADELAGVAALIAVLRGEDFATGRLLVTQELQPREIAPGERLQSADEPDAAAAFAGGAAADQAFAEPAALPPVAEPVAGPTTPTPPDPATPAAPPAGGGGAPAASATPPAAAGAVELDKNGLPHDGRIHSSPPKKNADGSWRQKRGVDPALVESVGAELRQIMAASGGAPAAPAAPAAAEVPAAPAAPLPPTGAASAPGPDIPAPPATAATGLGSTEPAGTASAAAGAEPAPVSEVPAAPVPPPPVAEVPAAPAAPAAPVGLTFADLMRKITGMQSAGNLTVEETQEIATGLGLTGVRDLMKRPDLIPAFDQLLPVIPAA